MNNEQLVKYNIKLTVRNQPGVLIRCVQVFAKKGGNIESLKVTADSTNHNISNMEISVYGSTEKIGNILKQLNKLIDVTSVSLLNKE